MRIIKLHLNKIQWSWLHNELRSIVEVSPVEGKELESLFLTEMFARRLHALTFFKPGKMGLMAFTFTQTEGYAINNFFADSSDGYNLMLRMLIEPHLLPGKPIL